MDCPWRGVEMVQCLAVIRFVLQPVQVPGILECELECLRKAAPDDVG